MNTVNVCDVRDQVSKLKMPIAEDLYMKTKAKLELPSKNRVPVRIIDPDSLGPAPLPEGYLEYLATKNIKQTIKLPTFQMDQKRKMQETIDYQKPVKKSAQVQLRQIGGEVWEDPTLAFWDESNYY